MTSKTETILMTMPGDVLPGGGWRVLAWAGPKDSQWWWITSPVVAWRVGRDDLAPLAPAVPAGTLANPERWVALAPGRSVADKAACAIGAFESLHELLTAAREGWERATGRTARIAGLADVEAEEKTDPEPLEPEDIDSLNAVQPPKRPRRFA